VDSTLTRVVLPSSALVKASPAGHARLLPVGDAGPSRYAVEGSAVPAAGRRLRTAPMTTPMCGTALPAAVLPTVLTAFAAAPAPQHTALLANDVQGPLSRGTPV
jgi:hypothetical protein